MWPLRNSAFLLHKETRSRSSWVIFVLMNHTELVFFFWRKPLTTLYLAKTTISPPSSGNGQCWQTNRKQRWLIGFNICWQLRQRWIVMTRSSADNARVADNVGEKETPRAWDNTCQVLKWHWTSCGGFSLSVCVCVCECVCVWRLTCNCSGWPLWKQLPLEQLLGRQLPRFADPQLHIQGKGHRNPQHRDALQFQASINKI